jgi:hypothetical protein
METNRKDSDKKSTAFSIYLRTGRRISADALEVKFNPWHDPADGKFTFARQGAYYPGGDQDRAGQSRSGRSENGKAARQPGGNIRPGGGSSGGGGATGSWGGPPKRNDPSGFRGGGGVFGGGGTSGSWAAVSGGKQGEHFRGIAGVPGSSGATGPGKSAKPKRKAVAAAPARAPKQAPAPTNRARSGDDVKSRLAAEKTSRAKEAITKNGYTYEFDDSSRTIHVTGDIVLESAGRNKPNQINAGKPDRLPDDQGGHYIAQRFNGPTDAFNHFAQNANFNKSGYARIEYKWEMAVKKGYEVSVDIKPFYERDSKRPYKIKVVYDINGKQVEREFNNEEGAGNDR